NDRQSHTLWVLYADRLGQQLTNNDLQSRQQNERQGDGYGVRSSAGRHRRAHVQLHQERLNAAEEALQTDGEMYRNITTAKCTQRQRRDRNTKLAGGDVAIKRGTVLKDRQQLPGQPVTLRGHLADSRFS